MPRVLSRMRWRMIGVGVLAASALGPFANLEGRQDDKPKAEGGPAPKLPRVYYGVEACSGCHTDGSKGLRPVLCKCDEAAIWKKDDKHPQAYNVLLGDRSKAMGKALNIMPHEDKSCLACHGVHAPAKDERDDTFKAEDGVSCVACHGPYSPWVSKHASTLAKERDTWRKLPRKEKEEQYGMTDLWDPARRSQLCASCHIGSSAEGKVVTHEMYAAGHPPLPSFEIATFSDQMPKHWDYLYQKPEAAQKLLRYDPNKLEQTELVLVGGLTSFTEQMRMLAGEAAARAKAADPEQRVLDLAQFDCASCHHDLKRPSWRQERGYKTTPGRPVIPNWPMALVKVAIQHAAKEEGQAKSSEQELLGALADLDRAYDKQPFGDSQEVAKAAEALVRWSEGLRTSLQGALFNKEGALRILRALAEYSAKEMPDFETARQLAWAFRTVYDDYARGDAADPAVKAALDELEKGLNLQLPAGSDKKILDFLQKSLERSAGYEPEQFRAAFAKLAKALPAK